MKGHPGHSRVKKITVKKKKKLISCCDNIIAQTWMQIELSKNEISYRELPWLMNGLRHWGGSEAFLTKCATDCFYFLGREGGEKKREKLILHFRWVQMHTYSSAIKGKSEIAIKQCVIFMPHLVTPSKHPHPTASRHPLLSCIPSSFLVTFVAACDTEAVGGRVGFPPSFSLSSTHYQCSTSDSACFLPSYTSHTHKQTNSYTNNSLDTCKAHAHSHPLSHTHKYMQTQLKPTHSRWPLNPFKSLKRINKGSRYVQTISAVEYLHAYSHNNVSAHTNATLSQTYWWDNK